MTDFSASTYWTKRFILEKSFEWLISVDDLLPYVLEIIKATSTSTGQSNEHEEFRILHLGCGTSALGPRLAEMLSSKSLSTRQYHVADADYVPLPQPKAPPPNYSLVVLDPLEPGQDVEGTWDLIVDKSTADAISCGPDRLVDNISFEPVHILAKNVAGMTRDDAKWISISYSSTRFDFLEQAEGIGWKVVRKEMIATAYIEGGRKIKENGIERIVYEPETGVWMWVLEKI